MSLGAPREAGQPRARVLVVDDSALMRRVLTRLLDAEPDLEVVGTAADGLQALEQVERLNPDVVTMDIEMPQLDGLGALTRIMQTRPRPVVMVSSLARPTATATVVALLRGAVDVVAKPSAGDPNALTEMRDELTRKVRAAARGRLGAPRPTGAPPRPTGTPPRAAGTPPRTAGTPPRAAGHPAPATACTRLVLVGSSTGGPQALREFLSGLPVDLAAALVVVQHMPVGFTAPLAARLDQDVPLTVREAVAGDQPVDGLALIAPAGRHLAFDARGHVVFDDSAPVHGVRPAVDVALESLPLGRGPVPAVVILTGMGVDGARGAKRIRDAGGPLFCQDEGSSVVWGMPRAAHEAAGASALLPPAGIAEQLVRLAGRRF